MLHANVRLLYCTWDHAYNLVSLGMRAGSFKEVASDKWFFSLEAIGIETSTALYTYSSPPHAAPLRSFSSSSIQKMISYSPQCLLLPCSPIIIRNKSGYLSSAAERLGYILTQAGIEDVISMKCVARFPTFPMQSTPVTLKRASKSQKSLSGT